MTLHTNADNLLAPNSYGFAEFLTPACDDERGERHAVTAVIRKGEWHYLPAPDLSGAESLTIMHNLRDQADAEGPEYVSVLDEMDRPVFDSEGESRTYAERIVGEFLTAHRFVVGNNGSLWSGTCIYGCGHTVLWPGFAGDLIDFALVGMHHVDNCRANRNRRLARDRAAAK